ncbi:MAG: metallophosphoesterase [Phycisphaerae bacterium]|nr:metallophosphoesterase [Phycisphaerae bacterium]
MDGLRTAVRLSPALFTFGRMRYKLAGMRIGVLSDTHDRLPAIDAALAAFARAGVQAILHPGDLVAPFAARRLLGWKGPLYVTYGNNDGEREGLRSILPQIQDGPVFVELAGKRILLQHDLARCKSTDLDKAEIVVTGHTHEVVNEVRDNRLVLNPGECCGWVSGRSTVAVLDTDAFSANIVELTL